MAAVTTPIMQALIGTTSDWLAILLPNADIGRGPNEDKAQESMQIGYILFAAYTYTG